MGLKNEQPLLSFMFTLSIPCGHCDDRGLGGMINMQNTVALAQEILEEIEVGSVGTG